MPNDRGAFARAALPGRSLSTFITGHLLALLEQRVCQHFPAVYNLAANVCVELKIVAWFLAGRKRLLEAVCPVSLCPGAAGSAAGSCQPLPAGLGWELLPGAHPGSVPLGRAGTMGGLLCITGARGWGTPQESGSDPGQLECRDCWPQEP